MCNESYQPHYDLYQLCVPERPLASGDCVLFSRGIRLRRLDRPQIEDQRTGIFARETKRRHVWMVEHKPFAQPIGEGIELHPPIERAEGGRTDVRALSAPANRMACRTHSF